MRRDLVLRMLGSIREHLFEDVMVEASGALPQLRPKGISGIVASVERFSEFGQDMRVGTHFTRATTESLPGIAKGQILVTADGRFRVLDIQPIDDGRFEVEISLDKLS